MYLEEGIEYEIFRGELFPYIDKKDSYVLCVL